jgi:hypothetical protein
MTLGHQLICAATGRQLRARFLAVALVTLVLVGPATVASAGDGTPVYGGYDWYASVYGMLGIDNSDASGSDPSGGATLSAGFRINRWLAAEVGGEWAQGFEYDRGTGPITCTGDGGRSTRYNAWQVTAGGRLYLGKEMIQPFLLGHGGFIQTRDSGGGRSCKGMGFVSRLGGGIEVFVNNSLAVSLLGVYVLPVTGKSQDHDYVSIGLGITWY